MEGEDIFGVLGVMLIGFVLPVFLMWDLLPLYIVSAFVCYTVFEVMYFKYLQKPKKKKVGRPLKNQPEPVDFGHFLVCNVLLVVAALWVGLAVYWIGVGVNEIIKNWHYMANDILRFFVGARQWLIHARPVFAIILNIIIAVLLYVLLKFALYKVFVKKEK